MARRPSTKGHPGWTLFGVLLAIGLVIAYWYLIAMVAAGVLAFFAIRQLLREREEHRDWRAQYQADVTRRADYEHQQFLAGRPDGVYGQYPPIE